MTRLVPPIVGLAFLLAGGVLAQTPPVGMTLQQFVDAGRGRLLDRDGDGDGRISAAEFAAGGQGRHARPADAQSGGDGGRGGGDMAARMFQRFDTNGDGYLDKGEIDAMLQRRFERMDMNHDGILTAEERESARGGMNGDRANRRPRPDQ